MKETARKQTVVKKKSAAARNRGRKEIRITTPRHKSTQERRLFEQLFYRLSTFFLAADSSQFNKKIEKGPLPQRVVLSLSFYAC